MIKHNRQLSLRTTNSLKNKLNTLAKEEKMNKSEFFTCRINQEYKYVIQLQKIQEAFCIVHNIFGILTKMMFDKHYILIEEFENEFVLKCYDEIKNSIDDISVSFNYVPKTDGNKEKHISVRLNHNVLEKLNDIAKFYNCNKSDIVPILLSKKKDISATSNILICFCHILDIRNYLYEKCIVNKKFEEEYKKLWEIIS